MNPLPLSENIRAQLLRDGLRIAAQQGFADLFGDHFLVFVRIDGDARKAHYSFRAPDDLSQDDPTDQWIQLR